MRGILIYLSGALLLISAGLKLSGLPAVHEQMAAIGFSGGKLLFIAGLEIASAVLFLWPRTRSIGLLLVSSYLGGAICAHVAGGEYGAAVRPAIVLALSWVGTWLQHPQMLWSLATKTADATAPVGQGMRNMVSRGA